MNVGGMAQIAGGIIAAQVLTKIASGIINIGLSSITAAGDAQEMLGKLDVTFGEFAQSLQKELIAFAEATGRSTFELRQMATDLGAVLKGMGFTNEAAAEMSVGMTQLAVDVGSFNNLPSAEVAQRFQRALTGEFESLKALGIVINQTRIDQELANRGITTAWLEMDQLSRATIIQDLIMESAADSIGDAAKTSGSFANRMIALKAAFEDTKTEIGLALLPAIEGLLAVFQALWKEHGPAIKAFLTDTLVPAISKVVDLISGFLSGDGVKLDLNKLIPPELMEGFISIKEGVMDLVEAFQESWPDIKKTVLEFVDWFMAEAVPVIGDLLSSIGDLLSALAEAWDEHGETIMDLVKGAFQFITATIGGALTIITGVIDAFLLLLKGDWEGAWNAIKEMVNKFMSLALSIVGVKLDEFKATWTENLRLAKLIIKLAFEKMIEIVGGFISKFFNMGKDIIEGLWRGIKEKIDAVKKRLKDALGVIMDLLRKITGATSPSKITMEIGRDMMRGMEIGIKQGLGGVEKALGSGGLAVGSGAGGTTIHFNITGDSSTSIAQEIARELKLQGVQI